MPTTNIRTVKTSGGDFTSLSAWESSRQADLTASDAIEFAECYQFDDNPTTINGWTTDATRYISIYVPRPQRHVGVQNSGGNGGYTLINYLFGRPLDILEENVRVEGIQTRGNSDSQEAIHIFVEATGTIDVRISGCFIGGNGTNNFDGIRCNGPTGGTLRLWNNIVWKMGEHGINLNAGSVTTYLYHNSIVGCAKSVSPGFADVIRQAGTVIAKSNLADARTSVGTASGNTAFSGTFDAASTGNVSSDTSDAGTDTINNATPLYVRDPVGNVRLSRQDTAARNVAVDLRNDSNLAVIDDCFGTLRPLGGVKPCAGANEPLLYNGSTFGLGGSW